MLALACVAEPCRTVEGVQFLGMGSCKLLPFVIYIRGVVCQLALFDSSFSESELLYKLAHLVASEYLLQLLIGQLFRVLLQFQKPLYTLFFCHHIAF